MNRYLKLKAKAYKKGSLFENSRRIGNTVVYGVLRDCNKKYANSRARRIIKAFIVDAVNIEV